MAEFCKWRLMLNKIICFIVILLFCSCSARTEKSTLVMENAEATKEVDVDQKVDLTPESVDEASQLEMLPGKEHGLADDKLQLIVVAYNNLEPPDSMNYLYLCNIDASCSRIFETSDTISSVSNLSTGGRKYLVVSIFDGSSISLLAIDLNEPSKVTEIETAGYSYLQDSNNSTILFINLPTSKTNSTSIFTFDLEEKKIDEIYIPCEVDSAKYGNRANDIYFNGSCNSHKALYSYDLKTKNTKIILDLPILQFIISPDRSKIAYNYFTNIAKLELFLPGESKRVTNDKLSIASSQPTMWVDSDKLFFTQKIKGNEVEYFIWNFDNNTISKADIPKATIALSRDLGFAVTASDPNEISIVNLETHDSATIEFHSDQSANMVYFIDIVE
jgi:hypothetical protein